MDHVWTDPNSFEGGHSWCERCGRSVEASPELVAVVEAMARRIERSLARELWSELNAWRQVVPAECQGRLPDGSPA